jgi:hypothetical protein
VSTAELKYDINRLLDETGDINMLFDIRQYFLKLKTKNSDWLENISDEQRNSIEKGVAQLEKGEGIAHQKVREKVNKLLKKNE